MPFVSSLLWASFALAAEPPIVRVSGMAEAIGLPFAAGVAMPLHPGFSGGASLWSKRAGRVQHRVQAELGMYHHPLIENAIFLLPTWQSTWFVHRSLGLSVVGGAGYKHALSPRPTYVLEGGTYERTARLGHPELTTCVGIGLEVPVAENVALYAQYRGHVDGPFAPSTGLALMTHITTVAGIEIRPKDKR